MAKVEIHSKLINRDGEFIFDGLGILKDDYLTYIDNGVSVKIKFDKEKIIIIRETSEYIITLEFRNEMVTKGNYYIKELNNNINIDINTRQLNIKKWSIVIDYCVILGGEDLGTNLFEIRYEVK